MALVVDWHQERIITVWIRWAINSTRVDCLYYERLSSFDWWNDIFQLPAHFPTLTVVSRRGLVASYLPDIVPVAYQIAVETVVSSSELLRGVAGVVSSAARDITRLAFIFGLA